MKDPIPENALPYNTTPRPRPKKWLLWTAPKDFEGFYSPFLPIAIVFFFLIVLLVYEVTFLRRQTFSLRNQNLHMAEAVQKANSQLALVQGLRADLQALEPSHPAAGAILKDFFPVAALPPTDAADAPKNADSAAK